MKRLAVLGAACALLAACSAPPAVIQPLPELGAAPAPVGRLTLDMADYASGLLPHYQRAVQACAGALDDAAAFRWSGWVAADGALVASAANLINPGESDALARCVTEKLKHTRLPAPPQNAPYVSGYPVAFAWSPV